MQSSKSCNHAITQFGKVFEILLKIWTYNRKTGKTVTNFMYLLQFDIFIYVISLDFFKINMTHVKNSLFSVLSWNKKKEREKFSCVRILIKLHCKLPYLVFVHKVIMRKKRGNFLSLVVIRLFDGLLADPWNKKICFFCLFASIQYIFQNGQPRMIKIICSDHYCQSFNLF